jgi:hypothetical protein
MKSYKMMTKIVSLILLFFSLSSCTSSHHSQNISNFQDNDLNDWLNQQLLPYLENQLSRYPRFKNQPVHLMLMDGDEIRTNVDLLSLSIRDLLKNRLVSTPGINLAWQPQNTSSNSPRSILAFPCRNLKRPSYYIGIDLQESHTPGFFTLKVKALNLAENRWMDGFGLSWQGALSHEQSRLHKKHTADPTLKGRRTLPFTEHEPDLIASYLAQKLSCQLSQSRIENLVVTVIPSGPNPFIKRISTLMERYLVQFKEVHVTDKRENSNVTIHLRAEHIVENVYQLWSSAERRIDKTSLQGMEINTYVRLTADTAEELTYAIPTAVPPQLLPTNSITPLTPHTKPPTPANLLVPQPLIIHSDPVDLIADFRIITPALPELCNSSTPWAAGILTPPINEPFYTNNCLAFEIAVNQPVDVFFLHQDVDGTLRPIDHMQNQLTTPIYPGSSLRFPTPSSGSIIEITGPPGSEWIYAIACNNKTLMTQLTSITHITGTSARKLQQWFEKLQQRHPHSFDWKPLPINHQAIL